MEVPGDVPIPTESTDSFTNNKENEDEEDDIPLTQDELLVAEAEKQQIERQKDN